ncbi:MAG: transposase [Candidatus Limiplasma sp.]|nr:transposase [Candidatus Limiplasma sp.]
MSCSRRSECFSKTPVKRKIYASSCYPAFFCGHKRIGSKEYYAMMRKRKIWSEGSFSVLKREHLISKIRKRGILCATEECLLAAMALDLKRMVNAILSLKFLSFRFYVSVCCS